MEMEIVAVKWPDAPSKGDLADFVEQGGTLEQFRGFPIVKLEHVPIKSEPKISDADSRPSINTSDKLHTVIDNTMSVLPKIENLYQRCAQLVHMASITQADGGYLESNYKTDAEQIKTWIGHPVIRELSPSRLTYELSKCADFVKHDSRKKELVSTNPTRLISTTICEFGEYQTVRPIKGIMSAPFLRPDGTICNSSGYDAATGFYLRLTDTVPHVLNEPSRSDALESYEILEDIFSDFPFENREQRAVPISIILSILARPCFGNVPGFLIDASTAGSGKTLSTDVASIIATGKIAPKTSYPSGKEWKTEIDKVLAAVALDAPSLLCFDNIPVGQKVGCAAIDRVITCNGCTQFRILGKTENRELPWNTILVFNGNNSTSFVFDESKRRILPCRMIPDVERPETRSNFKYPNLLHYVQQNRGVLLKAALTILRHWAIKRPVFLDPWGSFEEWSKVIPNAILAAGGPNIRENLSLTQNCVSDEDATIINIFKMLHNKFPNGATSKDIVQSTDPQVVETLNEAFLKTPSTNAIGNLLAGKKDRIFNGLKLRAVDGGGRLKKWVVEPIKRQS